MSYVIGGAYIEEMDMSYSWGLSPAGASIKVVGESSLVPGEAIALTLGGLTFLGFCTAPVVSQNYGTGTKEDVKIADQRLMLMYDTVYGSFNVPEIIEDNPLTPGIDRHRRYVHILPADWLNQLQTYTDTPLSAKAILDYCFGAATVHFTWARNYHARQSNLVHEVDANGGKKLGNIIQEISEAQALVFALTDDFTLTWALKGVDSLPDVPFGATDISSGEALTPNDTQITVIGDRNKRQVVITLEPDWMPDWQNFWLETKWLDEVNTQWGPFDDTQAGQALLAAKAREVTVRDYVTVTGNADYADYRKWGEGICRMEIPAWTYLNDIVWKAYRIPLGTVINSIPLYAVTDGVISGLDVEAQPLIASVVGSAEGVISLKDPQELYPDGKAYVLVQGVAVQLLDPSTRTLITEAQLESMNTVWSPSNDFTFDEKNLIIIFTTAQFTCGSGTGALLIFPNQGVSGIGAENPLYNVALPNANATVTAANVQACFCFSMERFATEETGTGTRRGQHYVSGLEEHLIDTSVGGGPLEISYLTGLTAQDLAAQYLAALTGQQASYANGGYKQWGVAGMALTDVVDRVTVHLAISTGLTQTVEYTKERMPAVFQGERDLDRKQRTVDLFPGQRELRQAARDLRTMALLFGGKRVNPSVYQSAYDVMQTVVGAPNADVAKFNDSAGSGRLWAGGTPVFYDAATNQQSFTGTIFAGIVVPDQASGPSIPIATSGVVPVLVKGPFNAGDKIGINNGSGQTAYSGGPNFIGVANATWAGTDIMLCPVALGAGNGQTYLALQVIDATTTVSGTTTYQVRVIWGQILTVIVGGSAQSFVTPTPFAALQTGDDASPCIVPVSASGVLELKIPSDVTTYLVAPLVALPAFSAVASLDAATEFLAVFALASLFKDTTNKRVVVSGQSVFGPVGYINALGIHILY